MPPWWEWIVIGRSGSYSYIRIIAYLVIRLNLIVRANTMTPAIAGVAQFGMVVFNSRHRRCELTNGRFTIKVRVMKVIVARIPGMSTTGQPHDLLIERTHDGYVMLTVMGADGKKRHASAKILPGALTDEVRAEERRSGRSL